MSIKTPRTLSLRMLSRTVVELVFAVTPSARLPRSISYQVNQPQELAKLKKTLLEANYSIHYLLVSTPFLIHRQVKIILASPATQYRVLDVPRTSTRVATV